MVTAAKRKINNRWDKDNMTVLGCKVRKDYAEQVKAAAKARGTTVNALFLSALAEFMDGAQGDGLRVSFDPAEDGFTVDQIKEAARAAGMSVNAWVLDLIRKELFGK